MNPFKPTAGAQPPLLIGREQALDDFTTGLADGPGAPGRLTLFTGARGVGKTVMLTEVGDRARQDGWVVIDVTVTPGLLDRIAAGAVRARRALDASPRTGRHVTGVTVAAVGGISFSELPQEAVPGLDDALRALLDAVEPRGAGLLITVDEVHRKGLDELRELAATYQHLVRDGRDVAFALAGLPSSVNDLLSDDVLTFLRRADRQLLRDVPLPAVSHALAQTIDDNGRRIDPDALAAATEATSGYPFMIQLVGYHVWRSADGEHIDAASARAGISAARLRLGSTVHEATLADLSEVDRTYLVAMAQDDGPSRTADIAARLERPLQYQNVYRERLIAAGVIRPSGRGFVDFAVPYLREYLRDHAARYEMRGRLRE